MHQNSTAEFKHKIAGRDLLSAPDYQAITAQAWSGMLAVLLMMFLVDLERFVMLGQYKELAESLVHDPGYLGLWVLVCLVCINVLMQLALRTFNAKPFRIFAFWITAAYTAFFILHQVVHLAGGESVGLHTPLDMTHHILGVWGCWAAWYASHAADSNCAPDSCRE